MNDLNTKLLINISLIGMLPGIAEILGLHADFVWMFWFAIWIFTAAVVTKRIKEKQFIHAAIAGFSAYIISVLVKILAFDVAGGEGMPSQLPDGTNPRIYIASLGIISAIICGLAAGFLQMGYKKFTASSGR